MGLQMVFVCRRKITRIDWIFNIFQLLKSVHLVTTGSITASGRPKVRLVCFAGE